MLNLRFNQLISYQQAAPASVSAGRSDGAAEGGPPVPRPPLQRLVGVPRRTVRADGHQVPVVLLGIVVMVRRPHVRRFLRASRCDEAQQRCSDVARHGFGLDGVPGGSTYGCRLSVRRNDPLSLRVQEVRWTRLGKCQVAVVMSWL